MSPDQEARERMQAIAREVHARIPPGWGFVVMVFPCEDREGLFNYVSNGDRALVVEALKEFIAKTEGTWGEHTQG